MKKFLKGILAFALSTAMVISNTPIINKFTDRNSLCGRYKISYGLFI